MATAIKTDALAAIKTVAVKAENAMVSRMTLTTMTKDREEDVRSFAAHLRGRAMVCNSRNTALTTHLKQSITPTTSSVMPSLKDLTTAISSKIYWDFNNQDMNLEFTIKFQTYKSQKDGGWAEIGRRNGIENQS